MRIFVVFAGIILLGFTLSSCDSKNSSSGQVKTSLKKPDKLEIDDPFFDGQTGEFKADKYTIALWHFNEGSITDKNENQVVSYDSSKKQNHGLFINGKWGSGLFKSCLDLSSSGVSFEVDDDKLHLSPGYAVTVEGWYYFNEIQRSPYPVLVTKPTSAEGGGDPTYRLFYINFRHEDYPEYAVYWEVSIKNKTTYNVGAHEHWNKLVGAWHYIAGTYNGEKIKLYIDGVLKDEKEVTGLLKIADRSLLIGTYKGNNFNGMVDEIRISNTARSEEAIKKYWEGAKRYRK